MLALYHDDGPLCCDVELGDAPFVPCAIFDVVGDYVYSWQILEPTAFSAFFDMIRKEIDTQISNRAIPQSCFYRGESLHVLMYYKAWVWLGREAATQPRSVCRHWNALAHWSGFLGGLVY